MGLSICYSNQMSIFNDIYMSRAHLLYECHITLTEKFEEVWRSHWPLCSCAFCLVLMKIIKDFSEKIMFRIYCTRRRHLRLIKEWVYIRKSSGQFSVALWAIRHPPLIKSQWSLVTKYRSSVSKYLIDRGMN